MKKILLTIILALVFTQAALSFRNFAEGTDYIIDFQQKEDTMADVLHIKFPDITPTPKEAETVIKDQLKIYGAFIENEKIEQQKAEANEQPADKKPEEEAQDEEKFKNIIGSVWIFDPSNPENMIKIKFKDDLSSFVYIGKTKRIVPFPDYITFLKKERDDKKEKDKAAVAAERTVNNE
ncbi:MAG: hypothetical protein FWF00_07185 [Endomicrobia bacterium]|nr:hypothetical protein [Endomicrobiia bacterium]MCL2507450.1 hypothetical protein [Endomicrobiia bacterium]